MSLGHQTAHRQRTSPSERPLAALDRTAVRPGNAGPKQLMHPRNSCTLDLPATNARHLIPHHQQYIRQINLATITHNNSANKKA